MPIALFFSSRQISANPIRNFRSNQSTPGRFDNIEIIGYLPFPMIISLHDMALYQR